MVPKVFASAAWQLDLRANESLIVWLTYWPMISLSVASFPNLHGHTLQAIGPQNLLWNLGQHSVCLPSFYLMLHDITAFEELSHPGLIPLYLQSNMQSNTGDTNLTSQTQPKKGNGPVYCVYKPCPTGMQLDRWHNQASHNRLSSTHGNGLFIFCKAILDRHCYYHQDGGWFAMSDKDIAFTCQYCLHVSNLSLTTHNLQNGEGSSHATIELLLR